MKKTFFKSFLISFLAFTLIYGGGTYYFTNYKNNVVKENDNFFDRIMEDDNDELVFLALGIDTRNISESSKERSDTMMLCKVDKSTGGISILSIPRDTRVMIRGRNTEEKINHAHAYGGPELAVKTVRDLIGIELDYYVRVDYKIVEEFVDLIGGVEVEVPFDMVYSDLADDPPLHINLKEGRQVLNGDKAIQFLRFRKGYADQDLGRIRAQQQFISAAMDQTLKPGNITKIPQMIKTYYKNVDTNIPFDVITKFAMKAKSFNTDNIDMATLPGEPQDIGGVSYYILEDEESEKLVKEMFTDHKTVEVEENNESDEIN